jgi:hypothetical protein
MPYGVTKGSVVDKDEANLAAVNLISVWAQSSKDGDVRHLNSITEFDLYSSYSDCMVALKALHKYSIGVVPHFEAWITVPHDIALLDMVFVGTMEEVIGAACAGIANKEGLLT